LNPNPGYRQRPQNPDGRAFAAVVVSRGLGSVQGVVKRLDMEGRADRAAPRRVRVQARQIYSFAKAAHLGWYPEGREIAMKGLDYLLAKAKSPMAGRALFTCSIRTGPH